VTRKEITESRPGLTRSDEVNLAAEQVEPESVDEPTAEVLQTEIAILEMEAGALKTRIGELRRRRAALLHRTATEADPNEERDRRIRHIKRQNEMRLELHTQRQALLERLPADLRSPIDVAMQHRQKDNLKRPI